MMRVAEERKAAHHPTSPLAFTSLSQKGDSQAVTVWRAEVNTRIRSSHVAYSILYRGKALVERFREVKQRLISLGL